MSVLHPVTTRVVEQLPDTALERAWFDFLRRADFPTHYASPELFREPDAVRGRYFAILACRGDAIVGVITGSRERGFCSCGLRARPQIAFGATEDKAEIATHLAEEVLRIAERRALVSLFSWEPISSLVDLGFQESKDPDGIVMLDLSKGPEQLLKEMVGTRRTDIRKGIKNGVEVHEAVDPVEIDAYIRIRERWAERKHLAPPDLEQQRNLFALRDIRRLFLATHNGEIIAGSVVRFLPGGIIEYAANSSVPDKMVLKPNDVLQWRIIEWACREGFTRYSLGGAHLFLRKFGGAIQEVYCYEMDRTLFHRHVLRQRAFRLAKKAMTVLPPSIRTRLVDAVRSRRSNAV